MRVKKFVAESLKSATDRMRTDLGPEAIVLATRSVPRGGLFSFAAKEMVEITAAIDDMPVRAGQKAAPRPHGVEAYLAAAAAGMKRTAPAPGSAGADGMAGLRTIADTVATQTAPRRTDDRSAMMDIRMLHDEVDGIKSTLKEIAGYMKYSRMPSLPTRLAEAYRTLVGNGVDTNFAAEIVQAVYRKTGDTDIEDASLIAGRIVDELSAAFRIAPPLPAGGRRIVVLVGPTGVGKTTTIAKLAALSKLSQGRTVGLISADTYRIGAIEQLRTFAGIADIPMEVVYEPSEMGPALARFQEKDVVYVDTVGRSQRGEKDLEELKQYVDAAGPDEVHLVLSAPTGVPTQLEVVNRFRMLQPNRLLFSKLDEVAAAGPLARVARETGIPLSYVTTGQTVPDDILQADARTLATMIYTGAPPHA